MAIDNTITVAGNITRDPELKFTASGTAKASFGLAVSRRWQNKQTQEWEEQTSFVNVVAWNQLAENCAESLLKGARVMVTGRLEIRPYETDDGEKRQAIEVVADDIGPSLKWASAEVTKSERRSGGSSYQSQSTDSGSLDEEPF